MPDQGRFDGIRPYTDAEVPKVVEKLFGSFIFRGLFKKLLTSVNPEWKKHELEDIVSSLRKVTTVREFQSAILTIIEPLKVRTITDLTESGLDELRKDTGYLFISNHRDIVVDSALINYLLHKNGHETCAIAIGDNLVGFPYVGDWVRLNKSFVIRRGIKDRKEMLAAMELQSAFIHQYIAQGQSMWIAQREGRAKDGNDFTNPAIISMLAYASRREDKTLEQTLAPLSIVPVSISYEDLPCDEHMAKETHARNKFGAYVKGVMEDFVSMRDGMFGFKGRVHIAFGAPLVDFSSRDAVVAAIDKQIITNYRLWSSNTFAAQLQENPGAIPQRADDAFYKKYLGVPAELRPLLLAMYANPVHNKSKCS